MEVDAVVHGLFDDRHPLAPGTKTVADTWAVLPYENEIVTIELAHDDFLALARDFGSGRESRNLMGVRVILSLIHIFLAGMIFLSMWDSELGDPIKDRINPPTKSDVP